MGEHVGKTIAKNIAALTIAGTLVYGLFRSLPTSAPLTDQVQEKSVENPTKSYTCNYSEPRYIPPRQRSVESVNLSFVPGESYAYWGTRSFEMESNWFGGGYDLKTNGETVGSIKEDQNGSLSLSFFPACRRFGITYVYLCNESKPLPPPPKREPEYWKGVFIRPCVGSFYSSFGGENKQAATNPIGRTVESACEDLMYSGVTDIFIGFKADDEKVKSGCGKDGNLLYPSKFELAQKNGFDPVGTIIKTCNQVYSDTSNRKTIRFHAWFPVFKDRAAANIAHMGAYRGDKFLEGITGKLGEIFGKKRAIDCSSDRFGDPRNPAVVEYELNLIREILDKYPELSGINLDYIRYPEVDNIEKCTIFDKDGNPIKGKDGKTQYFSVSSWLPDSEAIEDFVKNVKLELKKRNPNSFLSADIFPWKDYRHSLGQDKVPGQLDVIIPMLYTEAGNIDKGTISSEITDLKKDYPGKMIIADLRGWKLESESNTDVFLNNLSQDIVIAKKSGANGYAIFTYEAYIAESKSKVRPLQTQLKLVEF